MPRKPKADSAYTYRDGKKIDLTKREDQFVVRRTPGQLEAWEGEAMEQVSSASTRISCAPEQLEDYMVAARAEAPAYHAYEIAGTSEQLLITDRVMVRFEQAPTTEELVELQD